MATMRTMTGELRRDQWPSNLKKGEVLTSGHHGRLRLMSVRGRQGAEQGQHREVRDVGKQDEDEELRGADLKPDHEVQDELGGECQRGSDC